MNNQQIEILSTVVINDETYIDLQNIDGKLTTVQFRKEKEPNFFKSDRVEYGNQLEKFAKEIKNK